MTAAYVQQKERVAADKKRILALLKDAPEGMLSAEITKQLQLNSKYTRVLLIALRSSEDVSCTMIDAAKRIHIWSIRKDPIPTSKKEPLYPDFDKEHEEWRKQVLTPKQRFNPFGK
ncbi:MAG: hypothetical protein IPP10_15530 [Candidatus Competibacteraceae bacterium]|nr:hypothetical protein [Candidatus Competibacteraceae bacterium]